MNLLENNYRYKSRSLGILFLLTFLIHIVWTLYISNVENMIFIEHLQMFISAVYSNFGFDWKGASGYVVTAALASSFVLNGIRRFLEGVCFGWPQFKEHDRNSFRRASMVLMGYGVMMYFAVGFFGEKYSSRQLDLLNIGLIAMSTYIVGMFVDLIDDFISALYCICRGGNV